MTDTTELPDLGDARTDAAPVPGRGSHAWRDEAVLLSVAGAVLLAGVAVAPSAVRVVGLALVLFVPGFAVCSALVGPLRPEAFALRVGAWVVTSIGVLSGATFVVAAPGNHFDRGRIVLGVSGITLCAALVRLVRVSRSPAHAAIRDGYRLPRAVVVSRPAILLLCSIVAGAVLIGTISSLGAGKDAVPYIVARLADGEPDVPVSAPPRGTPLEVTVVVENHESARRTLTVVGGVDGGPVWKTEKVAIAPGHSSTVTLRGAVPRSGCTQRVVVSVRDRGSRPVAWLSRWVAGLPGLRCR